MDQETATRSRGYYILRGLIGLTAFVVGLVIGFIGWPWMIRDTTTTAKDGESTINQDPTPDYF